VIPPPSARPIHARLRSLLRLTETDVRHHARWDFPQHPSPAVALLEGYRQNWSHPLPLHLRLAALRLANGNSAHLQQAVTMARHHPRELLARVRARHGRLWRVFYLLRA
jgi:hypothetical protein